MAAVADVASGGDAHGIRRNGGGILFQEHPVSLLLLLVRFS